MSHSYDAPVRGSNSGHLSAVLIFLTSGPQPPRGLRVSPDPGQTPRPIRFGEDLELDPAAYQLRRAGRPLKLERIPLDILLLLAERPGQLVTREQIAERIWGKDAFLDVDNSLNGAIRKIRHALEDDPDQPRFIQTVTGRGYRFVATVVDAAPAQPPAQPPAAPPPPAPPPRRSSRPGSSRSPRRCRSSSPAPSSGRAGDPGRPAPAGSCWRSCRFRTSPATRGRST